MAGMDEALDKVCILIMFRENMRNESCIKKYIHLPFELRELIFTTLIGVNGFSILPDALVRTQQSAKRNRQRFARIKHIDESRIQQQGKYK